MSVFWKYAYFSDIADPSISQFNDILDMSRKRNAETGLTGILMRDDKTYFQYLEGRKNSVADCVLRISGDSRHNNMTAVFSSQTGALFFDGWSLARAKLPHRKQNLSAFRRFLMKLPTQERISIVDELCLNAELRQ